ncbi:MAG: hypothetical protein AAF546_11060, partial [Verrucomicrobiota bacterium]
MLPLLRSKGFLRIQIIFAFVVLLVVAQMQGQTSAPLNETGTDSVERADSEQEITPMLELETLVIKGQKIDR